MSNFSLLISRRSSRAQNISKFFFKIPDSSKSTFVVAICGECYLLLLSISAREAVRLPFPSKLKHSW